jgi:PEP-CTERM motif
MIQPFNTQTSCKPCLRSDDKMKANNHRTSLLGAFCALGALCAAPSAHAIIAINVLFEGSQVFSGEFGRTEIAGAFRLAGDGSVRSCDGSVMPAGQACGAGTELDTLLGNFSFDGTYDQDPFINWGLSVTNATSSNQNWTFQFSAPFLGGPLTSTLSSATGAGLVGNLLIESYVDDFPPNPADDSLTCSVLPCPTFSSVQTLSPVSGVTGPFGQRATFTIQGSTGQVPNNLQVQASLLLDNSIATVPEPSTLALFAVGLVGAGWTRRARTRPV